MPMVAECGGETTSSAPFRVAVLGSNLSAVTLARRLARAKNRLALEGELHLEVQVFKNMVDRKQNAADVFAPLCDYQSATFIRRSDDSTEFEEELALWKGLGLVEEASKEWRVGRGKQTGPVSSAGHQCIDFTPVALEPQSTRYKATGGGLNHLCDRLLVGLDQRTSPLSQTSDRGLQERLAVNYTLISKLSPWRSSSLDTDTNAFSGNPKWNLSGANNEQFGPFDLVIMCMDHNPRHTRRQGFKALLEQNFNPGDCAKAQSTGRVAACVARSIMCSAMAVLVEFPRVGRIAEALAKMEFDSLMLEGVPEIAVACRRPKEELAYRDQIQNGKRRCRDHSDNVWSIVSTSGFALEKRPRHSGAWDDAAVSDQLVKAFLSRVLHLQGADVSSAIPGRDYWLLTPTFHWHGPACLNMLGNDFLQQHCFIFDSKAGVGYCGDVCGGSGPAGAVTSAVAMAERVIEWCELASHGATASELEAMSSLPLQASDWQTRVPRSDEDDCPGGIWGTFTGRQEPDDKLDHTWEVAAKLNKRLCMEGGRDRFQTNNATVQHQHRYKKSQDTAGDFGKGGYSYGHNNKSKGKSKGYNDSNYVEYPPQWTKRRWTSKKANPPSGNSW